ncbi:MAG TPA: hypothetical protein VHG88_04080 [Burkholderiales bacterium]|nr:hypothetical protein [Burkholderiales bacterium]
MKSIDAEIAAVEERIAARKVLLRHTAATAKQRAAKRLGPPALIAGAVVLGLVAVRIVRGRKQKAEPVVAEDTKEQTKGFALGTLLMTGATWLLRSQFGGPVGLAQFVLSKVRERRSPATAEPAGIPPQVIR